MGDKTNQSIKRALDRGYTKEQIAEAYTKRLKAAGIEQERINAFLASHGLVPTISQQTFGKQLSESMRGFGRDVAGGLGAAYTVSKLGGGAAAQALSLPMAYALGSAGQNTEDLIRGETPGTFMESVKRYHGAGMKSLQDELIGGPLGKIFEVGAAPFAKKADPAVAEYGRRNKLPIPATASTPTRTARAFQWVGDIFTGGKLIGDIRREQLSKRFENLLDYTTSDFTNLTDKGTAGDVLAEAVKDAKKQLKARTGRAYKLFDKAVTDELGDKTLQMSNFINVANDLRYQIDKNKYPDLRQFLAEIGDRGRRTAGGMGMTGKEFDMFQKQIWEKTVKTHPWAGGRLWEAIETDLRGNSDVLWPALKAAKDASILEKTFNKNKAVQAILKKHNLGLSDRVILDAFRTGNFEAVNQIKKAVSSEAWDVASERFVRNMIETAWDASGEFKPQKFLNVYTNYRRQIKNVMPGIADNLDMLTEVMAKSMDDLMKVGSKPESTVARMAVSAVAGGGGALSSALTGSPMEIAMLMPEGFSMVLANAVRAPRGFFKKWLTTGLKPRGTAQMLRFAPRASDEDNKLFDLMGGP